MKRRRRRRRKIDSYFLYILLYDDFLCLQCLFADDEKLSEATM
jgi:hypothetical protein